MSFGAQAQRYDRTRPSYPAQLVDYLLTDDAVTVLDVGCGTGIASRLFVDRGCVVLGVEPDERMAAIARAHGLTVETGNFEDWNPAGRRFDLLISAQAWHWVDPVIGAKKASTLLSSGGRLGLFWNHATAPSDLAARFEEAYARHAPSLDGYSLLAGSIKPESRLRTTAASLSATGRFADIQIAAFGHDREYTTDGWLDQLRTHSDHQLLDCDQLSILLDAISTVIDSVGGKFVMHYDAMLVTARKAAA